MQSAFFLINVTPGCVNVLKSALDANRRVRYTWKVAGEWEIVALVVSDELDDLMDFKESLGELSHDYHDEESGKLLTRNFVQQVSVNLIFPDSDPRFAVPIGSPGAFPPRGEAR